MTRVALVVVSKAIVLGPEGIAGFSLIAEAAVRRTAETHERHDQATVLVETLEAA